MTKEEVNQHDLEWFQLRLKRRRAQVANLGNEKPVTFECLRRYVVKRNGKVGTAYNDDDSS